MIERHRVGTAPRAVLFYGEHSRVAGSGPRHDLVSLVSLTRVGLSAPAQPRLTKGGQPYQGLAVSDSRRANPGRGTIHRALRDRYWRLAVGGSEHTETGGRGEATPLPEAALRRPYVVTRSRPYPRQTRAARGAAPTSSPRVLRSSKPLSSVIDAVIDSALHSALHAVLYSVLNSSQSISPTPARNRRRLCRGGCGRRRHRSI